MLTSVKENTHGTIETHLDLFRKIRRLPTTGTTTEPSTLAGPSQALYRPYTLAGNA
jgi:hypothetical protein